MKVAKLIDNLSPSEIAGADIMYDDSSPGTYIIEKQGYQKVIDLNVLKKLDERSCVIWESEYLKEKAFGLISPEEQLPGIFEQGPDREAMDQLQNNKPPAYKLSLVEKIVYPIIIFLSMLVISTLCVALFSKGMGFSEILANSGWLIIVLTLISSVGFTYFLVFRSEE